MMNTMQQLRELISKHHLNVTERELYSIVRAYDISRPEPIDESDIVEMFARWLDEAPGSHWPTTFDELARVICSYNPQRAYLTALKCAALTQAARDWDLDASN